MTALSIRNMNRTVGERELKSGIPLTKLERLQAKLEIAESLQKQTSWTTIQEKGWIMEGDVFVALVDFANTDPAHILNTQQEPDWDAAEAEAAIVEVSSWTAEPLCDDSSDTEPKLGPQEPPQDYRIFNRRQADGIFRPLSEFFDGPSKVSRVTNWQEDEERDADRQAQVSELRNG